MEECLGFLSSKFESSKIRIFSKISSSSIGELPNPNIRIYRIISANYSQVRTNPS